MLKELERLDLLLWSFDTLSFVVGARLGGGGGPPAACLEPRRIELLAETDGTGE